MKRDIITRIRKTEWRWNQRLPMRRQAGGSAGGSHREKSDDKDGILSKNDALGARRIKGVVIERMRRRIMNEDQQRTTRLELSTVLPIKKDKSATTKRDNDGSIRKGLAVDKGIRCQRAVRTGKCIRA